MWTTRQGLLTALFAVLAAATWWLLRGMIEEPTQRVRARAPDHVVSDFSAIETDASGRPKRQLVAEQLRQFTAEDLSELDAPKLTLFDSDDTPPWKVASKHGLLLSHGDEVHLLDAVEIERAGSSELRSLRLETSELKIWPKRDYAQGDQPVRTESDHDWLTASGVRLWFARPSRVEYPGRVHISIAPTPTAAGSTKEATP